MHPFKELLRLMPRNVGQTTKTLKALKKIQQNKKPDHLEELIKEYEKEKALTENMSIRFKELVELDKK